jgi:hypothetical protein
VKRRKAATDRKLIKMRSVDNPHLPADFIERLQANYDPTMLRAYLDGEFVNLTTAPSTTASHARSM